MDVAVYLVGQAGTLDSDNPHCAPCIVCALSSVDGQIYRAGLTAMLDSGAFPNAIDSSIHSAMGLPISGDDTLHTVSHVERVSTCRGTILVHTARATIPVTTMFSVRPFRDMGLPYDLILGRQFLTQFDFGYTKTDGWFLRIPRTDTA